MYETGIDTATQADIAPGSAASNNHGRMRWVLLLLVWPAIALILAMHTQIYQTALQRSREDGPVRWADSFRYPVVESLFWALLTPAILWLSARCPLFSTRWPRSIGLLILANAATELPHALYRTPLHSFVYPTMVPIPPFGLLFRYYLTANVLNDVWVFWTIVMIAQFVGSYTRHTEQQRELARAQLQALTAQLQPHFFFNVLNSVSALMRYDAEAADEMIGRLSDLMRTTLKTPSPLEVPLREELALVGNYVEIERMRFVDRIGFAIHASDEVLDAAVPVLFLLPVVENAVRYAITPRISGGRIEIQAVRERDMLAVRVKDDGPGHQNGSHLREGIGLSNTRTRLQKHYSGAASLTYRSLTPKGFEVEFRLPFRLAPREVRK